MNRTFQQWLAIFTASVTLLTTASTAGAAGKPVQAAARTQVASAQGGAGQGKPRVSDRIIVKYRTPPGVSQADAVVEEKGLATVAANRTTGAVLQHITDGRTPEQVVASLRASGHVEYAQPDYIYSLNSTDPRYGEQWGIKNSGQTVAGWVGDGTTDVGAEAVWPTTKGSSSVIVAVIDGGVDINNPDLVGRIWTNPGEVAGDGIDNDHDGYVDDVHGWDFYYNDPIVNEANDEGVKHGTHVAGIIAAAANNGLGGTGVAPNVTIMPLKFLGPDGSGDTWAAISAIQYAQAHGAQIINASWGASGGTSADSALNNAIASSGLVFIAAAGNDGMNTDVTPHTPSSLGASNIISVAALDNQGYLASFSNWGANSVDVGAPGVDILSTLPHQAAQGAAVGVSGKSVYWGFGLENVAAPEQQSAMSQTLSYLGLSAGAKILLVEDDGTSFSATNDTIYSNALTGYTVSAWPVTPGQSGPTVSDIVYSGADAVVWFTGEELAGLTDPPLLTSTDQTTVADYVYNGGKVFLSGRDASSNLESSSLFVDTLGANVTGETEDALAAAPAGASGAYSSNLDIPPATPYLDTMTAGSGADLLLQYPATDYGYLSGTSMAAPFVSGVAALLKSAHPNATTDQIIQAILQAAHTPADQMASLAGLTTTGGQVKAADALAKLDAIRAAAAQVTTGGAVAPQGNRNFLYYSGATPDTVPSLPITVTTPTAGTATAMRVAIGNAGLAAPAWGAWTAITPAANASVATTVPAELDGWGEKRVYVEFKDANGVIGDPVVSAGPLYVISYVWFQTTPGVIPVANPATPTDVTVTAYGGGYAQWALQGADVYLEDQSGNLLTSAFTTDASGTAVIPGVTGAIGAKDYVKAADPSLNKWMSGWSELYFIDPAQKGSLTVGVTAGATPIQLVSVTARKLDNSTSFTYWNAAPPRALPLPAGTYNVEVGAEDTSGQHYLLYQSGVTVTNGLTTAVSLDATTTSTVTVQLGGKTDATAINSGEFSLHPTAWPNRVTQYVWLSDGTGTVKVTPGTYDARTSRSTTNDTSYDFAYSQNLSSNATIDLRRDPADKGTVLLTGLDGSGRAGFPEVFFQDRWGRGWGADAAGTTTVHLDPGTYPVYYYTGPWADQTTQVQFPTEDLTVTAGATKQVTLGGPLVLNATVGAITPGTTVTAAVYATEATGTGRSAASIWVANQLAQPQLTIRDAAGLQVYSGTLPGLGNSTIDIPAGTFTAPYSVEATLNTGNYQGVLQFPAPVLASGGGGGAPAPSNSPGDWTFSTPDAAATLTVDLDKVTIPDGDTLDLDASVPSDHSGFNNVTVKLPPALISKLEDGKKAIAVNTMGLKLRLSAAALSELGAKLQSNEELALTLAQQPAKAAETPLAAAQKDALHLVGDVFNIEVARTSDTGSVPIEPLHNAVQVTLPYAGGSDTRGVGVYRFNTASGSWEYRPSRIDDSGKQILFNTWEFSDYAVFALTKSFADMDGHWAKADVEWLADRGLVKGTNDDGSFSPERTITRAEFATMLVRALGNQRAGDAPQFADVPADAWYAAAVGAAARDGLIVGDNGRFRPNDPVTREEMAVMLQRAADFTGFKTAGSVSYADSLALFSDGGKVDAWAQTAMAAAIQQQWLKGRNGQLAPSAVATRAESATILRRFLIPLIP